MKSFREIAAGLGLKSTTDQLNDLEREVNDILTQAAKQSPAVAALVKAARAVPENMAILRLSDRDKEVSDLLYTIHKALEPFEG